MLRPFLALPFAQAVCTCQSGLISLNNDASAGCYAFCKPHSCDKSATCQVTADRKTTRWAQGSSENGHRAGRMEWAVYSAAILHSRQGGLGRTRGMARHVSDQSLWVSSCVCKDGEVGDGRACYGHLLHEVQKPNQIGLMLARLKLAIAMLGM